MNQINPESHQAAPADDLAGTVMLSAPFADHDAGHFFYAGPDGAQRLDLLLHLAPYSPLLVIAGKPGVGKTALLRQVLRRAHEGWRMALITARVEMGRDDLLREMARGFGLTLDPRIDHQQLYEALITQLRALRQNAQVPILLVDDAQYLSAAMMELILRLCAENDNSHTLSILLFGTPQLQNLLESHALNPLAARVTHTFEVTPLDEEETGAYIRHRMRAAGAEDGGPFDAMMINRIHAASGGIPARINDMAQRVLSGRPMGEVEHPRGAPVAGGGGKRLVLLATAAVVALLMLAGPLRTALFKPAPLNGPAPAPSIAPPPSDSEERVIRNSPQSAPPAGTDAVKPLPLPPQGETVPEPAPSPAPEAPAPAPPPPVSQSSPPASPAVPSEGAPVPAPAAPAEPPSPPESARVPGAAPVPPVSAGAEWVRAQPADHFTLQLMAVKDEETARRFIERHHLQDKAAYVRVQRDGKAFYAVFYGNYPSLLEARRAAKALPPKWDTPSPWIRSFKAVRAQIQ